MIWKWFLRSPRRRAADQRDDGWIVIRDSRFPSVDGRWFWRRGRRAGRLVVSVPDEFSFLLRLEYCQTPEIETREDGAVAQVWRRRP